jgi:NAD(P)-dependent dehydrogenase (short-subunit alcohol dehydrogenase family)
MATQTILITGAGRGIGKRLSIGFARSGMRVGLLARSKAELDLADLEIEHAGGRSLRLRADLRDYKEVSSAAERMRQEYGSIDAAVCASGAFGVIGPLAEADPKAWADAIQTDLLGAMHVCKAVLPHMIERRSGKILLLVGPGAETPRPRFSAYASANAALVRFAETLAEEVREANIQVNCMNPGPTYTSMIDEILAAGERAGARELSLAHEVRSNGGTSPERQFALAQFLISTRSNHLSGKLLGVNDDWRRLEQSNDTPELFTLRRVSRG